MIASNHVFDRNVFHNNYKGVKRRSEKDENKSLVLTGFWLMASQF